MDSIGVDSKGAILTSMVGTSGEQKLAELFTALLYALMEIGMLS